jgi:hypothetical protein
MWVKGQHDGRGMICMGIADKLFDDFTMSAMDAVIYSNGQPGILQGNFFEGLIMSHIKKPP